MQIDVKVNQSLDFKRTKEYNLTIRVENNGAQQLVIGEWSYYFHSFEGFLQDQEWRKCLIKTKMLPRSKILFSLFISPVCISKLTFSGTVSINKIFPNKNFLISQLYLWKLTLMLSSSWDKRNTKIIHQQHFCLFNSVVMHFSFSILAVATSNLHQIQKGRSVLKSTCSEDFKSNLIFDIWPSRSWKIDPRDHFQFSHFQVI